MPNVGQSKLVDSRLSRIHHDNRVEGSACGIRSRQRNRLHIVSRRWERRRIPAPEFFRPCVLASTLKRYPAACCSAVNPKQEEPARNAPKPYLVAVSEILLGRSPCSNRAALVALVILVESMNRREIKKAKMSDPAKMTKSERVELGQLIRKRERVMKSMAVERSAAMLLEFESQCAAIYSFDQDEVWEKAFKEAEKVVEDAQKIVADRCKEMGIPKEFAPGLHLDWYSRGQNAVAERRAELRRVAKAKIAVIEKEAVAKIERMSLEAQTEVVTNGLESVAARGFLERMPAIEVLMPALNASELKQLQDKKAAARKRRGY